MAALRDILGDTVDEQTCAFYLDAAGGDVEAATRLFFAQNEEQSQPASRQPSQPIASTQSAMSQFSLPNGRSACTCIAVQACLEFLRGGACANFDPAKIENICRKGVEIYNSVTQRGHLSAEEALLAEEFSSSNVSAAATFQGLTTEANAFEQELHRIAHGSGAVACVITKPPETLALFMATSGRMWIFDSHPRPHFGMAGAHLVEFASIPDCAGWLRTIFPGTDVGGGLMAALYNSFELTPIRVVA